MRPRTDAFPSAPEAAFLILALFLLEVVVGALLHDARGALRLDRAEIDALSVLIANGIVLTAAMRLAGVDYAGLFHESGASLAATAVLLLPLVAALVPGLLVAMSLLMHLVASLSPMSRWEEGLFERFASGSVPVIVSICVLAPVLEEMLFRGLVLRSFLRRCPRWPAIAASALLFGAAHLNIYQFVGGFVLGLVLGWLYERTRSLVPCIALHAFYNASVTWLGTEASGDTSRWADAWVLSLLVSGAALALLRRLLAPRPVKA